MSQGGLSREFDLFMEALERPPEGRAGFIDERCGSDDALRSRVLGLLDGHERAENRATTLGVQDSLSPTVPERIGPYRILSRLGEGGMGIVYSGEQSRPIRRRVAIKILKSGTDSSEVLARFDAERQALALMNHASIAQILDGGVDEGRPYFVMELIAGIPITEYCDGRALTVRERLELFVQVCDGVQHAHQRGIIHRDLKPSNVLVSEEGGVATPKIIDFGIAKAVTTRLSEATIHTAVGRIIGTPDYMSPEQADTNVLDIDTRSDVYSLGALLYELLSGRTVFGLGEQQAGLDAIREAILRDRPSRPSARFPAGSEDADRRAQQRSSSPPALSRAFRQELDWIALRALEKDRVRRYASPAELAEDIRRYLDGRAVEARPPSVGYRLRKFGGRHKGAMFAGVLVAASILAATVVSVTSAITANRQRAEAEQRADELARVSAFEAERLGVLEPQSFGQTVKDLILEGTGADDRASLEALLGEVNFTSVAMRAIDAHLFEETIAAIRSQFAADPEIRATLLQKTSDTMAKLGLSEGALGPQSEALQTRREVLGNAHADTIESIAQSAELMVILGRFDEAGELYEEALALARAHHNPASAAYLGVQSQYGLLLREQGRYDDAFKQQRSALRSYRTYHGESHPGTIRVLNELGLLLFEQGEHEEGLVYLKQGLDASRVRLEAHDPALLTAITNYGGALIRVGKLEEGAEYFAEALEGFRSAYGDDHHLTLTLVSNMGYILQELGRLEEAEPLYVESLESRRRVLGPDHPDTLTSELNLSNLYVERGTPADGVDLLRHVVEVRTRDLGPAHPRTVNAMINSSSLHREIGDLESALELGERLIRDAIPGLPEKHRLISSAYSQYARTLLAAERFEEAASVAETAREARIATYGTDHHLTRSSAELLGLVYEAWHERDPDAGHAETAAQWFERSGEP